MLFNSTGDYLPIDLLGQLSRLSCWCLDEVEEDKKDHGLLHNNYTAGDSFDSRFW